MPLPAVFLFRSPVLAAALGLTFISKLFPTGGNRLYYSVPPQRLEASTAPASKGSGRTNKYKCADVGHSYGYRGCSPVSCPGMDRTTMPMTDLEDIKTNARTGDIVLISGTGKSSKAIRGYTGSLWSHVGVIIKDIPDRVWAKYGKFRGPKGERNGGRDIPRNAGVYIFDADYEPDKSIDGPVIRPLEMHMKSDVQEFKKCLNVAYRALQITPAERITLAKHIFDFAVQVADATYTAQTVMTPKFFTLYAKTIGIPLKTTGKRYFCSEMLAHGFMKAGLLSENGKKAGNWMPQDFASVHGKTRIQKCDDINDLLTKGKYDVEQRIGLKSVGGTDSDGECPP